MPIPTEMQALQLESYNNNIAEALKQLKLVTKAVPQPERGQVLIKVKASPCNPSDLLFMQGQYLVSMPLPHVPGWEGTGTVVASGGGLLGWWLQGKRVAFTASTPKGGAWAEYAIAEAKSCIPLEKDLSDEAGATLIINPLTAVGMVDVARREGHKAIIQTAAASQLGRIVLQQALQEKMPIINVVRRQEQADLLRNLGADYVLNSSEEGFGKALHDLSRKLEATIAFDAVAGTTTGDLANAMPAKSTVLVYGDLSLQPVGNINALALLGEQKVIRGFILYQWLSEKGLLGKLFAAKKVQRLFIDGHIKTEVQSKSPLAAFPKAILRYTQNMTAGKVLVEI